MKENTNERLKLMHKHIALRLLWQMWPDGCTKAFPDARAGGVGGFWALGAGHKHPGPSDNLKHPLWLLGTPDGLYESNRVTLSYSNVGAPRPRTMLSLSPRQDLRLCSAPVGKLRHGDIPPAHTASPLHHGTG